MASLDFMAEGRKATGNVRDVKDRRKKVLVI